MYQIWEYISKLNFVVNMSSFCMELAENSKYAVFLYGNKLDFGE